MAEQIAKAAYRIDARKYAELMSKCPALMRKEFTAGLKSWAGHTVRKITEKLLTHRARGGGKSYLDALGRRSGDLARSFDAKMLAERSGTVSVAIVSTSPYAAIHEYGGVIQAKRSKYLTIPMKAMLTGAGFTRDSARSVLDEDDTFVFTSRNGNRFIARNNDSERKPFTLLFLLRKQVTIPARMGLRKMIKEESPELKRHIELAISRVLRSIGGK